MKTKTFLVIVIKKTSNSSL